MREREYNIGILSGKIDVISSVPVSFIISIASTIIPTIATYNRSNKKNVMSEIITKYIKYTLLLVLPCSLCMFALSNEILDFLFGNENGAIYLRISAITIIFIAMEQIINAVLQGIGKIFVPALSLSIGVTIKLILNIVFLKISPDKYWYGGVAGCCIATLVCHIIAFFVVFFVLQLKLKIKLKNFRFLLKAVLASCIMAVSWYYTYFLLCGIIIKKLAIILAGIIAVIIYTSSVFLLNLLSKDEISIIHMQKSKKI